MIIIAPLKDNQSIIVYIGFNLFKPVTMFLTRLLRIFTIYLRIFFAKIDSIFTASSNTSSFVFIVLYFFVLSKAYQIIINNAHWTEL